MGYSSTRSAGYLVRSRLTFNDQPRSFQSATMNDCSLRNLPLACLSASIMDVACRDENVEDRPGFGKIPVALLDV